MNFCQKFEEDLIRLHAQLIFNNLEHRICSSYTIQLGNRNTIIIYSTKRKICIENHFKLQKSSITFLS